MAQLIAKKFNLEPLPKSDQEFGVAVAKQLRRPKETAAPSFKSTLKLKLYSITDTSPAKGAILTEFAGKMVVKSWMFLMTGLR